MKDSGNRLSDILFTKIFSDNEGEKIISAYLKTVIYVALVLLPALGIYKILYFSVLYAIDYILASMILFFVFLLYLLSRRKVRLVSALFILGTWAGLTLMAVFSDGVKDIAVVAYIVVIFLSTLLIGASFSLIITVMSIISVWIMGFVPPANGFMPPGDIPVIMSIDYTILFIIIITSIILFAKSYQYSYERIDRELKERIRAEEKLSRNEISLKEKNVELLEAKEKAEESDRLKTAFIQNISHEIRTPMNGIVGSVELLQQPGIDNEKRSEYVGIINSCTNQLATLVTDFIDISRLESGAMERHISECTARDLLYDIEHTYSKSASDKGLSFLVLNEIGDAVFKSDQGKIRQILNNLVSNAVKFTSEGRITVRLSKPGDKILISVEDTGIGICKPDLEIIFQRFRQAEWGSNRTFGGSGLGLAISRGLAEFLGGKIWCESEPDKGSLFVFEIPVE